MFCTQCGSKIPDSARFCTNCGAPQAAPAPEPVVQQPPVFTPPAAEIPVAEAPVFVPPAAEAPAAKTSREEPAPMPQEPPAPAFQDDPWAQPDEDKTVRVTNWSEPAPIPAEPPVQNWNPPVQAPQPSAQNRQQPAQDWSQPVQSWNPPAQDLKQPAQPVVDFYSDAALLEKQDARKKKKPQKSEKKKNKTVLILAIVIPLVLIIGIGGFLGYRMYTMGQTYDEAQTALSSRDYDRALELFESLGNYEDSASIAADLTQKQEDYDEATELLEDGEYDQAATMFDRLKNYRDSAEQAKHNVPYQKALYIMTCAANGDENGLSLLPEPEETTDEDLSIIMYRGAADIFTGLGDYSDAAQKADDCWHAIGTAYLEQKNWEGADEAMTHMSDTMRRTFQTEYMKACADISAQGALINALREFDSFTVVNADYKAALTKHIELLSAYLDDYFYRDGIRVLLAEYIDGLTAEANTINDQGSITDSIGRFKALAAMSKALDALNADYGFLANDDELRGSFIGYTEYYDNCAAIGQDIYDQINGKVPETDDEIGYYLLYTNNTTCDFELTYHFVFRDGTEEVAKSETATVVIKAGETVKIALNEPENCPKWNRWVFYRSFEILE